MDLDKYYNVIVVGQGYVGLPLAVNAAKSGFKVYGFDISKEKIEELKNRLTMTESDDMRDVVDKKAIGEIKKNIALLEKRSKMYEANKNKLAKKLKPSATSGNGAPQGAVGVEEVLDESKAPMWEEAMKSVLKRKGY